MLLDFAPFMVAKEKQQMKKPLNDALARTELYLLGVRNNVEAADFPQALANCAELNGCVRRLFGAIQEAYKIELARRGNWDELDKLGKHGGKNDEPKML